MTVYSLFWRTSPEKVGQGSLQGQPSLKLKSPLTLPSEGGLSFLTEVSCSTAGQSPGLQCFG